MGKLTTHVLDTMNGKPAGGMRVQLRLLSADGQVVRDVTTNEDGRCEQPLLEGDEFQTGAWELVFHVSDYFAGMVEEKSAIPFLKEVPVRFGIEDIDAHYHVPLLVSPWSYTTYRGS